MTSKNELAVEYDTALTKRNQLQATLTQYGDLDTAIEEVTSNITELTKKFHDLIPNEDVDELLTNKIIKYGLIPISMDILPIQFQIIPSYEQSLLSAEEKAAVEATFPSVQLIQVTMDVSGKTSALSLLVDDIKAMDATQVSSINVDLKKTDEPIKIVFNMYVMQH